ncbi:MAG: hypothetical protein FJ146_04585 [Deltaproteobacteria bacterium]|nr:hypothetical protein [Deltaproteobacteria bacterium]
MSGKYPKHGAFRDYLDAMKVALSTTGAPSTKGQWVVVYGSSDALLGEAVAKLQATAVEAGAVVASCEANQLNESSLTSMLQQGSLFDPRILYLIRRCEAAKNLHKPLTFIASKDQGPNSLCFVYQGENLPVSVKASLLHRKATLVPCYLPWPNELPQVLSHFADGLKLKLTADGVQALLASNGDDLATNLNELRRLKCLFGNEAKALTATDLIAHLDGLRVDEANQLERLLLARQWAKAQALSSQLLLRGERALQILAIVASHIRVTLKLLDAHAQGVKSPAGLAQEAQVSTYVVKNYLPLVQRVRSAGTYRTALKLCHHADVSLKSRRCNEDLILAGIIDALAMT